MRLRLPVEAATKIQAVFRGHKVRATMKPGDDSATKAAAASSGQEEAATGTAKTPTKDEFEAEFDPNDKGEFRAPSCDVQLAEQSVHQAESMDKNSA